MGARKNYILFQALINMFWSVYKNYTDILTQNDGY